MELLAWMAVPGFFIILAYVVTAKMSYDARKEEIERDIDRLNYLDAWMLYASDKDPSWRHYEAERNTLRARLIRRGIEV